MVVCEVELDINDRIAWFEISGFISGRSRRLSCVYGGHEDPSVSHHNKGGM